jgi:RNA polymerase sigma factor (sigma-70 family)
MSQVAHNTLQKEASLTDEMSILEDYVRSRGEAAFRGLVERYINIVYAAAKRQTGDRHLAEDVTQAVFLILAQKARGVPKDRPLAAWLLKTTGYCASNARRARERRAAYESRAAAMMQASNHGVTAREESDWEAIAPMLDEALGGLRRQDRDLVLRRFFEGQSIGEVARGLGVSEDAASKRISRAVEELRGFLQRRGVAVSAGALGPMLMVKACEAAPAGLAAAVSAMAHGAVPSATAATIAKGAWVMTMSAKAKAAIAAGVMLVAGAAITVVTGELADGRPEAAPATEPLGKWPVKFSDGSVVKVVGLREYSSKGKWWGLDGSEMADPGLSESGSRGEMFGEQLTIGQYNARGRARCIVLVLQMMGTAIADKSLVVDVDPRMEVSILKKSNGDRTTLFFVAAVPLTSKTITARFGLAKEAWVDKEFYDATMGPVAGDAPPVLKSMTEIDGGSLTEVRVVEPPRNPERQWTVVAMVDGRAWRPRKVEDRGPLEGTVYTFECGKDRVKKLIYRERPCEWQEIKNVSVEPTTMPTVVEIGAGTAGTAPARQ